ncbi:5-methyltetrahydropteroyltriglutamate--homocysteine S-methyltransferase, partial [candidate division WOR-3 bacterium]|nr:5-methyltetrahydropteroyltriglutamate--homocysteine S-methyltransferase [candidate division WOR-3 bacterium]
MKTYAYGFPRLGQNREYKKSIESFWKRETSKQELVSKIFQLEREIIDKYENSVDKFPVGEMTFYDNMLDTALMLGLYPYKTLEEYYDLCWGKSALELSKWFNTNYHYLIPEFPQDFSPSPQDSANKFKLLWNKPKEAFERYKIGAKRKSRSGGKGIPYMIGPFTFLKLSKGLKSKDFEDSLLALGAIYKEIIKDFPEVHIDEPALVMEISQVELSLFKQVYNEIGHSSKINLFTYYDSVDYLEILYSLPLQAIGLDFVQGKANLDEIRKYGFPEDKVLIAGIVNGRNVLRGNIEYYLALLKELSGYAKNIEISNAGPLYHLPISVKQEKFPPELSGKLAFANEKLEELKTIGRMVEEREPTLKNLEDFKHKIPQDIKRLKEKDFKRAVTFQERRKIQNKVLDLPLFPTTTIGSFPQTPDIRKKRADFRTGKISKEEYKSFIKTKIEELIKLQEDIGLDVLVHGEFERSDMIEFFAEKLEGITTTKNGWIISYGTRCYRPPIIYDDVKRKAPLTLEEIAFAQSITKKPVKAILTGPVTIVSWSFVRDDIPLPLVAYQISLALQEEVKDLEKAGIKIIQIDEPAFREKTPIKKRDWETYFDWAIKSFRLASSLSSPETQIHTHMCYSEFGEILEYIEKMDFDCITIEASRSRGDTLQYFKDINFERQIGPGVWDVHSP